MAMYPRIVPVGDCGLTIEFGNEISPTINERVHAFSEHLVRSPIPGILETIPTYHTFTLYYDPLLIEMDTLSKQLEDKIRTISALPEKTYRHIEVPVFYGEAFGPDLIELAHQANLSTEEVVRLHCSIEYRVYMLGFSPGFPYLGSVPQAIALPRLAEPRLHVPAGSVGIAGQQTGIYPQDSPGGWRIIGQTPLVLYADSDKHPFLLKAGDRVRFRSITMKEFERLRT